ncbi:MAG: arginine deiminase family protein [Nocardioidaceae bacterium]|nr:arginine deiminase family protein [Nocardioidaceae bacterium]
MTTTLPWGRHYAMVEPDHFRVDYAINPFMDTRDQPDPVRARAEWEALRDVLTGLGARVEVFEARQDSPDMVFAMNLGLALAAADGTPDRVVMSHMRFAERRQETLTAAGSFAALGYEPGYVGRDGVGGSWESGDAFPHGGELLVGHGKRSDEVGLKALAADLQVAVRGLRIVHPAMYHLDLAFCPLDERRAMVCPEAFDADGAAAVLDRVAEPLVLTVEEALTFCANSVVVGRTVVMPACPPRVRAQLEAWDLEVVVVPMGELHKGGGSIRCMTNPLDITLGRDLLHVAGGSLDLG